MNRTKAPNDAAAHCPVAEWEMKRGRSFRTDPASRPQVRERRTCDGCLTKNASEGDLNLCPDVPLLTIAILPAGTLNCAEGVVE